ncbi:MAG: AAA family ATPase [Rikenellaceae bacterium]
MRILAIRGCNLASLEGEFEIDFTAEPLSSAGIFAITGSTGSGKSTILDAVCLALFNDTPRINKVERDVIIDVKDTTVSLGDSRNILRRGTGSGYAEVDFVSLSGDKYRSRWSVRRAREKANGSMQPWSIELTNLTTSEPQQGGKSELLMKIRELIGLTFDQFTRAVLLAQGDFATFLKANKNEKADLLEKLTGTDIYSRISAKIYENRAEAKSALEVVERNIQGVELLSVEQLKGYNEESGKVEAEIKTLGAEQKRFSETIKWIDQDILLLKGVDEAAKILKTNSDSLEGAKPRFDYLARIDSVQSIRDDYKLLESVHSQLSTANRSLVTHQSSQGQNKVELAKSTTQLQLATDAKAKIDNEWQAVQPNIIKARQLDTQIVSMASSLRDIEKDVAAANKLKRKSDTKISECQKEISEIGIEQKEIAKWFDTHSNFAATVTKTDLILSYIKDAYSNQKLSKSNTTQIDKVRKLLEQDKKNLEKWNAAATRLNTILPTEIATLRQALIDGEPCPVCGSIHHPISTAEVDTLAQQELIDAKAEASQEIERIEGNIKSRQDEVISLTSIVEGYDGQVKILLSNLGESLASLPNWMESFNDGTLSKFVRSTSDLWYSNESKRTGHTNSAKLKEQELKSTSERAEEIAASLKEKQAKEVETSANLSKLKSDRAELFDGESVEAIEQANKKYTETANVTLESAATQHKTLSEKEKEITGAISQIFENITQLTQRDSELNNVVSEWITNRDEPITLEELTSLLANNSEWIVTERSSLTKIKDDVSTAQTTLNERTKVHSEHQRAEVKPAEDQTKITISEQVAAITIQLTEKRERATEIKVKLAKYQDDTILIKRYEVELTEKRSTANNWQKLNELFGSADGGKFKTMAQGYTLDVLLGYANRHLSEISDRYLLERVSQESLALQVRDLDMLSEVRSVHSLSGGESFLISLALALGLSSLSSNKMRVESLFIDEGFGTLDADTLRVAMDVLERLQTQGRKIGVISHVAEMTERITTQIQVLKTTNGRSHIELK